MSAGATSAGSDIGRRRHQSWRYRPRRHRPRRHRSWRYRARRHRPRGHRPRGHRRQRSVRAGGRTGRGDVHGARQHTARRTAGLRDRRRRVRQRPPLHRAGVDWKAPTVGNVSNYRVYRVDGPTVVAGQTKTLVAQVRGNGRDPGLLGDRHQGAAERTLFTYLVAAQFNDGTARRRVELYATILSVNEAPTANGDSYSTSQRHGAQRQHRRPRWERRPGQRHGCRQHAR